MATHYSLGNSPAPETADQYFRAKWALSPMVAIFCSLPLHDDFLAEKRVFRESGDDRNLLIYGADVNVKDDRGRTYSKRVNIPNGMIARKFLLYFFAKFYQDPDYVENLENGWDILIEKLGYDNYKSRHKNRFWESIEQVIKSEYSFLYDEDNELYGLKKRTDNHNKMFLGRVENGVLKNLFLNKNFMFNCGFPVDFRKVIHSKKKALFWNIYLFLADVLPCINVANGHSLPWRYLHHVFAGNYKLVANFKNEFLKQIKEVEEIYPAIRGKYGADRKFFYMHYAPPPVPRRIDGKTPPSNPPSPAAPSMAMPIPDSNTG